MTTPDNLPPPIDMVLHCPACGMQHIDGPDPNADHWCVGCSPEDCVGCLDVPQERKRWTNPPHRSHLCHGCGHIWRPADVPTNGVAAVKTKGKADSPLAAMAAERGRQAAANVVPGRMKCAKCQLGLTRVNLYVSAGTVGAGGNETEPCPNGCGPLWPVTWEQEAREGWATNEAMFDRMKAAEDALAAIRAAGPSLVHPAPPAPQPHTNKEG